MCQEFATCGLFSPVMAMSCKEDSTDLTSIGPGVTRGKVLGPGGKDSVCDLFIRLMAGSR